MNRDQLANSLGARIDMLVAERRRIVRLRDEVAVEARVSHHLTNALNLISRAEEELTNAREALA